MDREAPARPLLTHPTRRGALAGLLSLAACGPISLGGARNGPRVDTTAPVTVGLLVPAGSSTPGNDILASNLETPRGWRSATWTAWPSTCGSMPPRGDPAVAAQVARQAVDDGARILLGPVHGAEASAVGTAMAALGINVLSFSNNPAIAGNNVFVLGLTPDNAARRVLSYAAAHDRGRVMVIGERTTAGELMMASVNRAAAETGVEIVSVETYEFSQQGIVAALPQMASSARSSGAQSILFTADSAGALPVLAQLLPDNRIAYPQFQFLGVTQWNIPPATLQLRGLQDGWFTLPDPAVTQQFESRYTAAYGAAPHPIAGLAYDGIAAIGALLGTGSPEALSHSALRQASGFVGVNGVFRFLDDGTNERGLAVATIRDNAVMILDPAPRSFVGA
jgi:amino acid/amide ABC transporter substrate-binding protein, HAAT family (TC 3.A.1.4.-)